MTDDELLEPMRRAAELEKKKYKPNGMTREQLADWILANTMKVGDCSFWLGAKSDNGYGHTCLRNERIAVHRLIYEIKVGPIGDFHVCHRCDNRCCVNPEHLFLGSNQDNIRDKVLKGRAHRHGGTRKLTWAQADEIRVSTDQTKRLAEKYGVCKSVIRSIRRGESWSDNQRPRRAFRAKFGGDK